MSKCIAEDVLVWFTSSLGTDGTYLHVEGFKGTPDTNLAYLCGVFREEDIMKCVHECIERRASGYIMELQHTDNSVIRDRLRTHKVYFSLDWVSCPVDSRYGVVKITRCLTYDMLLKEYECLRYLCETVGKGLGIFELDPVSGKSWLLFGTEEYSRLCTASMDELKEFGVPAVGRYIPDEDRRRAAKYMHQSMCSLSSWTIAPRIYRDGAYRFTRFAGICTPGDKGTVLSSVIAEDFSDHAREIEKANVEKSASCMLRSFLSAVFDVSFYIDNQYRILDDSSKIQHFLGTRTKGKPFEQFLLNTDQARFSSFMSSRKKDQPGEIASMIRVRICTGKGDLMDVELFCSPNFVQSVDGLDFSSNVSTICPSDAGVIEDQPTEFLIGLRVLSDSPRPQDPIEQSTTRSYRDIVSCVRRAVDDTCTIDDWIMPGSGGPSPDSEEIEDTVLRFIPRDKQKAFRESITKRDFLSCEQVLRENDLDVGGIFGQMFINMAKSGMPFDETRRLLSTLNKSRSSNDIALLFEITLAGLSLGLGVSVSEGSFVDWLRLLFAQSIRAANVMEDIPDVHIIIYHVCVLWGCLCKKLGRLDEAVVVLEHTVTDLKSYTVLYPECRVGRKLEYIARHNLAVEMLRSGNFFDALRLSTNVGAI